MSSSTAPSEARGAPALRAGAGLLAVFGYQLLAHWAVSRAPGSMFPGSMLAVLVAFAPLAVLLAWAGWRRHPLIGVAACLAGCLLAVLAAGAPALARALPLVPQLTVLLALGWVFGRSLLRGREPLLTRAARTVHGTLPPPIAAYTRRLTWMWALFLFALSAGSALLFTIAPLRVWSLFANLLTLPLVALAFLAEYLYRHLRFPWFAHATIAQSLQAFSRANGVAPADPRTRW